MKLRHSVLCLALASFASPALFAQEPVVGVADPEALFHNKDKKLDANMQVVMHIMRDLLEANHWDKLQGHSPIAREYPVRFTPAHGSLCGALLRQSG